MAYPFVEKELQERHYSNQSCRSTFLPLLVVVTVVAMVLALRRTTVLLLVLRFLPMFLVLVLGLGSHEGAGKGTNDTMASLVAKKATTESTSYSTHETTIALLSGSGIGGTVLLLLAILILLTVGVVGVMRWGVLVVGSLLGKLLRWIALGVLATGLGQHVCSKVRYS